MTIVFAKLGGLKIVLDLIFNNKESEIIQISC